MSHPSTDPEQEQEQWLRMPAAEEVFRPGNNAWLMLEKYNFPLKFSVRVYGFKAQQLSLVLPPDWWKLVVFETGQRVRVDCRFKSGVYTFRGSVLAAIPQAVPSLVLNQETDLAQQQRRLFYRVPIASSFSIRRAELPDQSVLEHVTAVLKDISAGGIGAQIPVFLPNGTRLLTENLLQSTVGEVWEKPHGLEVIWCRVQRPTGYCLGASFVFENEKEQDEMVRIITQLQRLWLIKYYHAI